MQEENAIYSKYPVVQLDTPPKGTVQESDGKTADDVDSPHVSIDNDDKGEGVNNEVIANTNSDMTVDSEIVAEVLVSFLFTPCIRA